MIVVIVTLGSAPELGQTEMMGATSMRLSTDVLYIILWSYLDSECLSDAIFASNVSEFAFPGCLNGFRQQEVVSSLSSLRQ